MHGELGQTQFAPVSGLWRAHRELITAKLLSPLLIPPLLLVTSISLLPLLFSMQLCEPLWVSLTVENLFTLNLDVLSLVLYGWRSLETTKRIRLKARGRRPKTKT